LCGTNSRPREHVGPRVAPVRLGLIVACDAPRLCSHGKHGNRQLPRCVSGDEITEQALGSWGGRVDGVVRGEDDDACPTLFGTCHIAEDRGAAQAIGQEGSERRKEADL
jgi:hypothetical protein